MGGGVTTANAMEYLDAGASHVIVTSFVFREGRLVEERLAELVRWSVHSWWRSLVVEVIGGGGHW